MKGSIIYLLSFFLCQQTYSQEISATIHGKVMDESTKEILENATVQLMRSGNAAVIRKIICGKNGFVFNHVSPGNYRLLVSYVGYRDSSFSIRVNEKDTVYNMGNLLLHSVAAQLAEVVVKAVLPPVTVKKDTVIFNPDAFPTRPNSTVEELLRRLPGFEVDMDGNVTFQGQKIEKVYVDGKAFFLNDPKLAIQNLLADMLQRVEVYDERSDRARMTGIPDTNPRKMINLRTKPGMKKGLFGDAEAAYASQNRHGMSVLGNYFRGDSYFQGNASSNNGANGKGNPGMLNSSVNNFKIDYGNNKGEKMQFTAGTNFSANRNSSRMTNNRQTFFTDSSLLQNRVSGSGNMSNEKNIHFNLVYNIDLKNTISGGATVSANRSENSSSDETNTQIEKISNRGLLNTAYSGNHTKSNTLNWNFNVNYSHQFRKPGRYVGLNLNNENNQSDANGEQQSIVRFYTGNAVTDSLVRNQTTVSNGNGKNLAFAISYSEPVAKGQAVELGYNMGSNTNNADQRNYNFNPLTGNYDELDTLVSNAFENNNVSHRFTVGYNAMKDKFRYNLGISAENRLQENFNKGFSRKDIIQRTNTFFPKASITFGGAGLERNITVSYNGSSQQPSIYQLQPVPDYTNPLMVQLGNPNLKQEFNNTISISLQKFNAKKSKNLMASVNYSNTYERIVNSTKTTAQGIQEQQYVNVNGNYSISGNLNYGMPVVKGNLKGNLRINSNVRYGSSKSFVNGLINTGKNFNLQQMLQLNVHTGNKFFLNFNASLNWNRMAYSIQTIRGNSFFTQNYMSNVLYKLPGDWTIGSTFNLMVRGARGKLPGSHTQVWNASFSKRLLKDKVGELKFSVYDILNKNKSFNQRAADNYIETNEMEVLKRVFALSFSYRFRVKKI